MNEQTLWTSGTAVVVAFFTTVIAQYIFAPSLEARKQTLINRSKVASDTADTMRAMRFELDTAHMQLFKLNDPYNFQAHGAALGHLVDGFDAADSLKHSGLKQKYVAVACCAQYEAEIFTMFDQPASHMYVSLARLLDHASQAIDPVKLPWVRSFHCRQGMRIYTSMSRPYAGVGADE
jgi:hypothetical protein